MKYHRFHAILSTDSGAIFTTAWRCIGCPVRKHGVCIGLSNPTRSLGAALSSVPVRTDGAMEMINPLPLGFRPRLWMGGRYATQEAGCSLESDGLISVARRAGVKER